MKQFLLTIITLYICATAQDSVWNYTTDSLAVQAILDSQITGRPLIYYEIDYKWIDGVGIPYYTVERPMTVKDVSRMYNGRIKSLFIGGLIGPKLIKEIGYLTELESLDVSQNRIKHFPPELFSLKQLRFLDLSGNELTELQPEVFTLRNLRILKLGMNNLSTLPPGIGQVDSLCNLDLYRNIFFKFPLEICRLTQLAWLKLTSNQIDSIPREIGDNTELLQLDLDDNQLSYLPPEIGNCRKLEILSLSSNLLTSLPDEIGNLKHIVRLGLNSNHLSSLPDSIVLLDSILLQIGDNCLQAVTGTQDAWLSRYAGVNWRTTQKVCEEMIVPPRSKKMSIPFSTNVPSEIFTIRGTRVRTGQLYGGIPQNKLPHGIYLFRQTNSGITIMAKRSVVR